MLSLGGFYFTCPFDSTHHCEEVKLTFKGLEISEVSMQIDPSEINAPINLMSFFM